MYDQNSVDELPRIMTKHQTILVKLDSQKFKNISPEKAEGRSFKMLSLYALSNWLKAPSRKYQVENPRKNLLKNLENF